MKIQPTGNQGAWALWFITEREEDLAVPIHERPESSVAHPTKRLEWLAGRRLLLELTRYFGLVYHGTYKDENGKPFLTRHAHPISLTHSYPYVAAQIDLSQEVGIDLEQPKEKLLHIAHRILAPSELIDAGSDVVKHCIYWCAKETMYKVYGKKGLFFLDQLQVEPFTLKNCGNLIGMIHSHEYVRQITMTYEVHPDYVLVHTKPQ